MKYSKALYTRFKVLEKPERILSGTNSCLLLVIFFFFFFFFFFLIEEYINKKEM